ncbi:MAG: SGNH/GDSL hydrolase family protein, partial [Sphingobacteriaceae bacterium]
MSNIYNRKIISNDPTTLPGSALEFYGDSITIGQSVSTSQRWTALVCAALSKTEQNYGVGGYQWQDATRIVYNNHVDGIPSFLAFGVNDVTRNQTRFDQIQRIVQSLALYCTLPAANKVNARNATASSGWTNTGLFNTIGLMTNAAASNNSSNNVFTPTNPTLSTTVKGRYVGLSATVVNTASATNNWTLTVTIDGNTMAGSPITFYNALDTSLSDIKGSFGPYLLLYDLGSAATGVSHTISISAAAVGTYIDRAFVDYFFGFDNGLNTAVPVFLVQPTNFEYPFYTSITPSGSPAQMNVYNDMLRETARYFSIQLGLPVKFIAEPLTQTFGNLNTDLVHPNTN